MIFKETIDRLSENIENAVNELFIAAWENQTHPQDILLIDQHGFYNQMLDNEHAKEKLNISPFVIGPDEIGFGETTFYRFLDWYRQSHLFLKSEYEDELKKDEEVKKQEELSLQVEQGIYLRFWESDYILKQYYQLTSLAIGESYDWYLKIPIHPREGSKHEVIRKEIRDRVKETCPNFYSLVKENYNSQMRNAIAHSHYYIMGRGISFLNYSDDPAAHSPIRNITFDEWYDIFHSILLLHNSTLRAFKKSRDIYKGVTLKNNNSIEIRITSNDGTETFSKLGIQHDREEWIWRGSLNDEDLNQ